MSRTINSKRLLAIIPGAVFAAVLAVVIVMGAAGMAQKANAEAPDYTVKATAKAEQLDVNPGVYMVKAVKGNTIAGNATLGIPSVSKDTLVDHATTESPAIIMGAAVNYEKKVPGQVAYETLPGAKLVAPYKYFRWQIVDEQGQDGTVHRKLSGFDGSYYIVRVDVSDIIDTNDDGKIDEQDTATLNGAYLHVKQENNKALMVAVGMGGDGQNTWTYCNGMNKTGSYALKDMAAALKDTGADDTDKNTPYLDIILMSSGKLADGADAGTSQATGADVKLSFYVDSVKEYNDLTALDPNNMPTFPLKKTVTFHKKDGSTFEKEIEFADELKYNESLLQKFYVSEYPKATDEEQAVSAETADNAYTSYTVMGSDLEIDVTVDETETNPNTKPDFWSLTNAIASQIYDDHTIKLICEVPVLEGLEISGTKEKPRKVILDVNSFDIQIANHKDQDKAGLTVNHDATLEIDDNTMTYGAELAIGNNAKMNINEGGTMIVGESCSMEVEYDAATVVPGQDQQPATDLHEGEIYVNDGGKLINNGVVNIEGMEVKPKEPAQEGQQPVQRDVRKAWMIVKKGGEFINNGCMGVKGGLKVNGTLTNYGKYDDIIRAGDPDKGYIDHHKGIQLSWKDVVTDPEDPVEPGRMDLGYKESETDTDMVVGKNAVLNNYGDTVLVPGIINLQGKLNNTKNPQGSYSGHIYLVTVDEAIEPIIPDPNNPTVVEKRVKVDPPRKSEFNELSGSTIISRGYIGEAKVELLHNGVLGKLTPIYTVKFHSNGGSQIADQTVPGGEKIKKPKDPTKKGLVLDGWFKDQNLKNKWNFEKDTAPASAESPVIDLYAKWKRVKSVTVNAKKVNKAVINAAVKKAGGSKKYITTIILGKKVKKIAARSFAGCNKVKTLVVKSKKLKKKSVRNSLKRSKIRKVKVKVGNKKINKKYVKKYRKIFTKKNAGRKVKVTR